MTRIRKKKGAGEGRRFVIWMTVAGLILVSGYAAFLWVYGKPRKRVESAGGKMTVTDPVCEMKVIPPGHGHVEFRAKDYWFCSESCMEDFKKDPLKYLEGREKKEMSK